MASKKIALYGGSLNPFGWHHRLIVELLLKHFDLVIIVICGVRPDKESTNDIQPVHRAAITDLSVYGLPPERVRIEYFDLENDSFTRSHDLEKVFAHEGELWHVVGADLMQPGSSSSIRTWEEPDFVWNNLRFAIIQRRGYSLEGADLPPRSLVLDGSEIPEASSKLIRTRLYSGESIKGLMVPAAAEYIYRHQLYRGREPQMVSKIQLTDPRPILFVNKDKPGAVAAAQPFLKYEDRKTGNIILAFGGDGTLNHAAHELWRRRIPILGFNYGGVGYNMNTLSKPPDMDLLCQPMEVWQLPLLYTEMLSINGDKISGFAYNDAWVITDGARKNQSAWMEVLINGVVKMPRVIGDGMLVSTAQGSTAYAKSMHAARLWPKSNHFQLVGNHVYFPDNFTRALIDPHSRVIVRALPESINRVGPLYGHIDGRIVAGPVTEMSARISRFASIELAFLPGQGLDSKLDKSQFGS